MDVHLTGGETMAEEIDWKEYVSKQLTHEDERIELFYVKLISDQTKEFSGQKFDAFMLHKFDRLELRD